MLYTLKRSQNITLYAVINLQILCFGQEYSIIAQTKNIHILLFLLNEITTMNVTIIFNN